MKKTIAVLALTAALTFAAPLAALAEESDGYPPPPPTAPSLAGSTATGECDGDVPWISYNVVLVDPDGTVTNPAADLVLSNGSQSVTLPLGKLVDNQLSGRVLWPGAAVDGQGNPTGWPGWAFENGQWVQTDGNYAWTRGPISATIVVNPDLPVALSYPAATPECANGPLLSNDSPASSGDTAANGALLPATGLGASLAPYAIVGAALAAAGGAVFLLARRRAARN
ncbi:LPXTG cell wall anchor domain-containing protein [Microbacterium sp. NPDC057407]|uniref:LPXTG cell wall anchor domain-containing protein n=1 Tax=Microbacterium sp. NPDC057407 TaxID=3346120 RepID=UPI00366ED0FA